LPKPASQSEEPRRGTEPHHLRPNSTTRRWKRLAQSLGLSAGVFLLCVAAFEFVLRANGYGQLEIYEPDPALYWRLKPNQNCYTKIDHKPVRINSQGTRGSEFRPDKPANTLRILCLGDSRTFGWGLSEAETYSSRLQKQLQDQLGTNKTVEVINAGVNAWSFTQILVYFRQTALPYRPDIVILAEGNLWTQFSEKNPPEFVKKMMSRVRLKNFLRRFAIYHYLVEVKLKSFYERQRTKFIPVDPKQDNLFKGEQNPEPATVFRGALEGICQLALERGIKPVLLHLPAANEPGSTNSSTVLPLKRAISQELNVPLVDLTPEVQQAGNALYLQGDPVHFNSAGNEKIARRLFDIVSPLTTP